ncbi:MAG: hypothetical protein AAF959_18585 [Cyanobacteria bacterium P01_D01_bin.56]
MPNVDEYGWKRRCRGMGKGGEPQSEVGNFQNFSYSNSVNRLKHSIQRRRL